MRFTVKLLSATLFLSACGFATAQSMEITKNGTQKAITGAEKLFTGTSIVNPYFSSKDNGVSAASVTFAPASRSNWHTHPKGQYLVVTAGSGYVQEWGQSKQTINPGDVIWTPPGVKHWHGATESTMLTHLAVQMFEDGKNVEWMEKVTDEQYEK